MIERAPFGATGHESSRTIFGAAALGSVSKQDADRTLETAARARHQPHRRRGELRRRRAAHRVVAAAPRGRVLPGHEDRRADLPRRARGDPPLARPPRRRPRRLDPAAQPRRRDRVGDRARRRRRARGGDRGARGGARALHRRHRPRPVDPRDAPAQPRALPVRLRAVPVQLRPDAGRALRRDVRGAGDASAQERNVALQTIKSLASRRWDGRAATAVDLVRAAARAARHRPRGALGARPARGRSCSPPATSRSCRGCSTRRSASSERPSDEQMDELTRRADLAPLFV